MSTLVPKSRSVMAVAVVLAAATVTAEPLTIDSGFFAAGFSLGVDFVFNTPNGPHDPAASSAKKAFRRRDLPSSSRDRARNRPSTPSSQV
jgi:hypothetical protein